MYDAQPTAPLSVVVLTRDEEVNLPQCLQSLRPLVPAVFVVDSGSTDRTIEIARAAGCEVVHHGFVTYADQFNWALQNLPIRTPWVMRLDADERISPELAAELREHLRASPDDVAGLLIRRRVYFWGRWIRHGGYYPTWLLRVWRHGLAGCEGRWMDEHMVVEGGTILRCRGDLVEENRKGLGFWVDKHNWYAHREVRDLLEASTRWTAAPKPAGQAGRRRWLKEQVYLRLPLFVRPALYWFYRYVLRLGFLDGLPGFVFHYMQAFWYRYLIDAMLYEKRQSGTAPGSTGEFASGVPEQPPASEPDAAL